VRAQDKVTIITGSTKGIGRGTAAEFAREGAKVVVSGRNEEEGLSLVKEIEADGGTATYVRADVSVEADCQALVEAAVDTYGRVDILVNNAAPLDVVGSGGEASILNITEENLDYIIKVALYGSIWCSKHAILKMRETGGGSIIMVSSTASVAGMPGVPAYTAAKGAINALTRQIAIEFAPDNIRCNCVLVGFVPVGALGGMIDASPKLGRLWREAVVFPRHGTPEDIARAAIYFGTEESGYTTGTILPVDGGITAQTVLPDMDQITTILQRG
jgi:NAD(P)-dependent dehydrogenase (short-subunit alcohol dehydrogenase family)